MRGAAAPDDVFGGFQADGTAAEDQRREAGLFRERLLQSERILHPPERPRVFAKTFDRRENGFGAGRENELVVREVVGFVRREVSHRKRLSFAVDRKRFVALADVDRVLLGDRRGVRGVKALEADDPARVVRKRAVRKGNLVAALQKNNVGRFVQSAKTRGGGDAGGDAAHDDVAHEGLPFLRNSVGTRENCSEGGLREPIGPEKKEGGLVFCGQKKGSVDQAP